MSQKPFLVVSYCIPDRVSGTPVVIRKFLENFSRDEVVLIGRPTQNRERLRNIKLPYPTLKIPTPPVGFLGERIWRTISSILGVFTGLAAILRYKPNAILAFYRDESSLLTGFLLHKITKLPFYAYFCDLFLENYPNGYYGRLARWLQPRVFMNAKNIFVLTEGMKKYFESQYGIDAIVLPHCNNEIVNAKPQKETLGDPLKIAYLGNLDNDRIISLKYLTKSIEHDERYLLYYFTSISPSFFELNDLLVKNSVVKFIPSEKSLYEELDKCDVLFLPAITEKRELQMMTGFHTKIIDYLVCQKTILAHSKTEYFVSKFFSEFDCGYVVEGGVTEISNALQEIRMNAELRNRMASNAVKALGYFDGTSVATKFRQAMME